MSIEIVFLSVFTALVGYLLYRIRGAYQLAYIENYRFLHSIGRKVQDHYPHLSDEQVQLVLEGLREYFYICKMAKRAWRLSCARHSIDPTRPAELPLLFSIDKELNIADGFFYSKNCKLGSYGGRGNDYCAAHIGCTSGCSGSTGGCGGFFGDSDGGSSGCGCGD